MKQAIVYNMILQCVSAILYNLEPRVHHTLVTLPVSGYHGDNIWTSQYGCHGENVVAMTTLVSEMTGCVHTLSRDYDNTFL